jgi:hypothetical protein
MKYTLLPAALAIFLFSCSRQPSEVVPDHLLSPDSMVSILVDIHLAEAAAGIRNINDVQSFKAQQFYPAIYKIHRTDSTTFHNSFDYYMKRPEKLVAIYDKVLSELSERESKTRKQ